MAEGRPRRGENGHMHNKVAKYPRGDNLEFQFFENKMNKMLMTNILGKTFISFQERKKFPP